MSSIFPNVRERLLTAIVVHADYPTPPSNEMREYVIGQRPPDATLEDIELAFGDGVYRLVGIGAERDAQGNVRTVTRDVRVHRVAKGSPPTWIDKVQAMIDRTMIPQPPPFHGHLGHSSMMHGLPQMPGQDAFMPPGLQGMAPMPTLGGGFLGASSQPISVPLGNGENLVVAQGLPPDELQSRIDRAQTDMRERMESKNMNELLMSILNAQLQNAQQAAAKAEQRASATEERLMSIVLGGGPGGPSASAPSDSAMKALQDTIEHQRRQIADMEDRSRRDRSDHWDEIDRWKRRCAEIEDAFRAERRKNEELISKLAKADIDAMMAGAKGPGGESDEEKTQRKIAMFAQLAQNLAPVAGPILAKLGILPGPDQVAAQPQQQYQQVPSGDVMAPPPAMEGGQG